MITQKITGIHDEVWFATSYSKDMKNYQKYIESDSIFFIFGPKSGQVLVINE